MQIKISPAAESDLDAIAALEAENFSLPWKRADFAVMRAEPDRCLLAAKADGELVGYIGAYTVARETDVTTVAVRADKRRAGVGQALLEALCAALAGKSDVIFLEVRESNASARRLYARCGYTEIGVRRGYYAKPTEDAVLYRKTLS